MAQCRNWSTSDLVMWSFNNYITHCTTANSHLTNAEALLFVHIFIDRAYSVAIGAPPAEPSPATVRNSAVDRQATCRLASDLPVSGRSTLPDTRSRLRR